MSKRKNKSSPKRRASKTQFRGTKSTFGAPVPGSGAALRALGKSGSPFPDNSAAQLGMERALNIAKSSARVVKSRAKTALVTAAKNPKVMATGAFLGGAAAAGGGTALANRLLGRASPKPRSRSTSRVRKAAGGAAALALAAGLGYGAYRAASAMRRRRSRSRSGSRKSRASRRSRSRPRSARAASPRPRTKRVRKASAKRRTRRSRSRSASPVKA